MEAIYLYKTKKQLLKEAEEKGVTVKELIDRIYREKKRLNVAKKISHQQRLNWWKIHRFDKEQKIIEKHSSAAQRFEDTINNKILGLNQFKKQTEMSDKDYKEAKKNIELHERREKILNERRADRKARIESEKKRVSMKAAKDLERFIESEKKRKARKEEKLSKYAGLKMKVAPRPTAVSEKAVKLGKDEAIYLIKIRYSNGDKTYESALPPTSNYTEKQLMDRMNKIHEYQMGKKTKGYKGVFAYNSTNPSVCVKQLVAA